MGLGVFRNGVSFPDRTPARWTATEAAAVSEPRKKGRLAGGLLI
jgi:hypothetical protein